MTDTPILVQRRNYEQSMGLWLNERLLHHPGKIPGYVNRLADDGYEIVRLLLRKTNLPHESPVVVEAARVAAEAAHERGIRVVMDLEPHASVARALGARFPSATAIKLVPCRTRVDDGHWTLRVPVPSMIMGPEPIHDGIEAAFLDGRPIPVPEAHFEYSTDSFGYGDTRDDNDYVERKGPCQGACAGAGPSALWTLRGRLSAGTSGELLLFYRIRDLGQVDFSAPELRTYYAELLERYRDTGIDGVSWDEPGEGNDWTSYRWADAFPAFFRNLHGYDPVPRLNLLEGPLTAESARFRLDLHSAQTEALRQAQAAFLSYAARILGRPLLAGNHHTWQGEGGINDYRCGESDYFRLAETLDAGYTDCSWWDQRSVRYAYHLARALARLTPTGEAVVNSWHQHPSVRSARYNARLMCLMRITWFNISFGEATDTCLYPAHRTYPIQAEAMRRNRDFLRATAGARPLTEIAVLHDWEGVCAVNLPSVAGLHKGFVMNLADLAVERSFPVEFIDTRMLAAASLHDGRLVCAAGDFSTVVVPDAVVLRRASWEALVAFGRAGGTVVFVGAPPTFTSEGDDLTKPFAELFGMESVPFERYHAWFEANGQPLSDGRPEAYDVVYPAEAPRSDPDAEGRPGAIVRSASGAFVWFTGYLPSRDVADFLLARWTPPVRVYSDHPVQYQFFRCGADTFLCVIALDDTPLRLILERDGALRQIEGDTLVWERLAEGGLVFPHAI